MFTIYDSKEEIYHQPYFLINTSVAIRQFTDMANDDTKIAKHPEDYTLWYLGSYEDSSATIKPAKTKTCVAHANECVYQLDNLKTA